MGYLIFFIGLAVMLLGMVLMVIKTSPANIQQETSDKSIIKTNHEKDFGLLLSKVSEDNSSNYNNIEKLILEIGYKLEEIKLSNESNSNKLDKLVEQHKDITSESNITIVEMIEKLTRQSQITHDKAVFNSIATADEIFNKLMLLVEQNDLKSNYYEATNKIEHSNLSSYFDSLRKSIS